MAVDVYEGGTRKTLRPGTAVAQGGSYRTLKYLCAAKNVPNPWPGGDEDRPPDWQDPLTVWTVVAAFEPPNKAPPTPTLWALPEHEGDHPPPRIDAQVNLIPGLHEPPPEDDIITRSWWREVWYEFNGSFYRDRTIQDPDLRWYIDEWDDIRGEGWLRVRTRYVNEAGAGPWSGLSERIFVSPGGY